VAALVLATGGAAGWLGDDFRWLGGVALSEVALTRVLWRTGALRRRPWARLGLRLGSAAVVLHLLGITMPDASLVGWVLLLSALSCLVWVGLLRLVGLHVAAGADVVTIMALAAAVGLWFDVVGVPPSGWSPIVAVLAGATAVEAAGSGASEGLAW
jgi:hypothetical protein